MKTSAIIAIIFLAVPLVIFGQSGMEAAGARCGQMPAMGPGHGPMGGGGCCEMGPGMRGGKGHGIGMGMLLGMADKLKLTADQKAKMEKLQTDFKLAAIDQQAKIKKAQIMLREAMRDEKAGAASVEAKIDETARLRAEMAKMKYRHHQEIKGLLTETQKDMLKKMMEERPMMKRVKEIRIMEGKAPEGQEN